MGKPLTYVTPSIRDDKVIVKIVEDDIKRQKEVWNSALIGYVLGDTPYVRSMENYVNTVWNFVDKPKILYHEEGYYIFKFQTVEDRDLVLQSGPYTYHNKPMILRNWEIDFYFDPECLSTVPLWVKFPGLPVGYWSPEALGKLASGIGKPLYTDETTVDMERISYARVLIEVDVAQPLPECIELDTPFGTFQQQVTYDWRPKFCVDCIKFGHDAEDCWKIKSGAKEETYQEVAKRRRRRNRKKKPIWIAKELEENKVAQQDEIQPVEEEGETQQSVAQIQNMQGQPNDQEINTKAKGKSKVVQKPVMQDPVMIMKANRYSVPRIDESKTTGE
ncbi:PREDICTED: uncharacterized protein LOC109215869 [Nicotiana attenuata]|uniref:uncharacterized protein LOC109215869 n=1 Tax=Nicotiana attenuata TaxID=49451 RepID=UPI0009049644|nr:PREDICTED: uncharacterized protein LOC109215869 [Nicotiana attenuata]